ncbi:MAG: ubiquinol oxidase subunit II [Panacagrimonas sp.]
MSTRGLIAALLAASAPSLAGCKVVLLQPSGDVAVQQSNLLVASTLLMLVIIVPVIALTFVFAWRYRRANTEAPYEPDWDHSTQLELYIWAAPLLIVIALGAMTWISTHTLDPYRPIQRISAQQPLAAGTKPVRIQAVALDWKWLFLYPDHGIAVVNELAVPIDVPIAFQITSPTVMNALFIPALAGMVYAMPGMETRLHAVINEPGDYEGISGNYSGAGYSGMRFRFKGLSNADFERWLAQAKEQGAALTRPAYQELERPTEREPVRYYKAVAEGLYKSIVNLCVEPTKMCLHDMMAIDARGGLGLGGIPNLSRLSYERPHPSGDMVVAMRTEYVTALCAPEAAASTLQR